MADVFYNRQLITAHRGGYEFIEQWVKTHVE